MLACFVHKKECREYEIFVRSCLRFREIRVNTAKIDDIMSIFWHIVLSSLGYSIV